MYGEPAVIDARFEAVDEAVSPLQQIPGIARLEHQRAFDTVKRVSRALTRQCHKTR